MCETWLAYSFTLCKYFPLTKNIWSITIEFFWAQSRRQGTIDLQTLEDVEYVTLDRHHGLKLIYVVFNFLDVCCNTPCIISCLCTAFTIQQSVSGDIFKVSSVIKPFLSENTSL